MTTNDIINKYLRFGGERNERDFAEFLKETNQVKLRNDQGSKDYILLEYIEDKLIKGLSACLVHRKIDVEIAEKSKADIETFLKLSGRLSGAGSTKPKKKAPKKKTKKPVKGNGDLGKIVDQGKTAPHGKIDTYWRNEGMEVVFKADDPKVRSGAKVPETYQYTSPKFIEKYYKLSGIEFGNWLSQQDRFNYVTGLGLALFDLHKALGFKPEQIGINERLSVAFGARGRGKARAHFEWGTFAINLTRYSRPEKLKSRPHTFKRVDLILKDGGVGSFAHEYGHALDFFGGMHVASEKGDSFSLSGDNDTNPKPNMALLKQNTLRGLMEKLLFKINWKTQNQRSNYYARLSQVAKTDYYFERCEIFARAFEVYVHYKLNKHKYYNAFLNKTKYRQGLYLTFAEMKAIEKDFDALINAIKKHLK